MAVSVLIGPFWPEGLRFELATLIDGEDPNGPALGSTVPCLAIVESAMLKVRSLRLPPASRAAADAWVRFDTEPQGLYKLALGLCAFRDEGASSEISEGQLPVSIEETS